MANNTLKSALPAFMQDEVRRKWGREYLKLVPPERNFSPDIKVKLPSHLKEKFFDSLFWSGFAKTENTKRWNSLMVEHPEVKSFLIASVIQEYKDIIKPDAFDVFMAYYLFKNKNVLYIPDVKKTKANIAAGHASPLVLTKNIGSFHTWQNAVGRIKEEDVYLLFHNFYATSFNVVDKGRSPIIFKDKPLYLVITSKPNDILRMAISEYFDSCQNLYTGQIKERLLSNVFDKNMKVAYIACDIPYTDERNNVHPMTVFARRIIRKKQDGEIYFDRTYPDFHEIGQTFKAILNEMGVKDTTKAGFYHVNRADLQGLLAPYMDRMTLRYEVQQNTLINFKKWLKNSLEKKQWDSGMFSDEVKQSMRGLGMQGKKIFIQQLISFVNLRYLQLYNVFDILEDFSQDKCDIPIAYYQIFLDELLKARKRSKFKYAKELLDYHVHTARGRSLKHDKQVLALVHGILPMKNIALEFFDDDDSVKVQKYWKSLCKTKAQKKEYEAVIKEYC